MKLPVVGPTYTIDDATFDAQRCVNLFPEASESGSSKSVARLRGTPGKELGVTAGGGPMRGCMTTSGGRCFFVSGNTLYELSTAFVATSRGTLNTVNGRVRFAENGTQVMMVDGTNGYIFTLATNNLAVISDADFPDDATSVQFMDTYFLVNDPPTGAFYISDNNDGTAWAATDYTNAEYKPDASVALVADHGELYILGKKSGEVYYNSGNAAFPFERRTQAVFQVGCAAGDTAMSFDNNLIWLGNDEHGGLFVYMLNEAYRPIRVSNIALEQAIEASSNISEAYAYTYKEQGHEFYCLQIPDATSTWVFDAATKMWHERMYYDQTLRRETQDRASCHCFFNNHHLAGDRINGNVYKQRLDYYSDNGDEIHRIRITPHITVENKRIAITDVYLDMRTGVGLASGQGSDPQVILQVSKDGGRTYGNERWRSFGKQGEYKKRPRWATIGSGRDIVLMFKITDPVPVSISDCYGNIT